jgi:hypothetical protein
LPPPLRVIRPRPSSTTRRWVLITLAVAVITMVTGSGPQLKVMMPPAATSRTTADDVQLAGLPLPITWLGWLVLTARPAGGTEKWPWGLPKSGTTAADVVPTAAVVACDAGAAVAGIAPSPIMSAPTSPPASTRAPSKVPKPAIRRMAPDARGRLRLTARARTASVRIGRLWIAVRGVHSVLEGITVWSVGGPAT